jgi:hypothetical protein
MRGDLDDEVGVERGGDPVQQRDGGYDAACFKAGQGGLGHSGAGGELGPGQAEREAAVADGFAEKVGTLGFCVALAVLVAIAALAGKILVGGVAAGHVRMPPGRRCRARARADEHASNGDA